MTPSELKYQVEQHNPSSCFFTRSAMKFFGDTMRNYGVCSAGDCWELFRKKAVKHRLNSSAYFDKVTFKVTFKRALSVEDNLERRK